MPSPKQPKPPSKHWHVRVLLLSGRETVLTYHGNREYKARDAAMHRQDVDRVLSVWEAAEPVVTHG